MYGAAPPIPPPPFQISQARLPASGNKAEELHLIANSQILPAKSTPPPRQLAEGTCRKPIPGGVGWGGHGHTARYLEMGRKWSFPLKKPNKKRGASPIAAMEVWTPPQRPEGGWDVLGGSSAPSAQLGAQRTTPPPGTVPSPQRHHPNGTGLCPPPTPRLTAAVGSGGPAPHRGVPPWG